MTKTFGKYYILTNNVNDKCTNYQIITTDVTYNMKILPIYKNKIVSLPAEAISEKLSTASKDELKVLFAVYLEQDFVLSEISSKLDMTENAFKRALNSWEKAGVITIIDDKQRKEPHKTRTTAKSEEKKSAKHSTKSKVEIKTTLPHYTSDEMARVVEHKTGCSELLDSCQQILGKIFNAAETAVILGLVDHLSLSNDYIMLLCSHASAMEKRSVRYVEKLALHYFDSDVLTYHELETELKGIEHRASFEGFVRKLFGLGKRALIKKEKEYIAAWSDKYCFSREMVELAYEITVAKTNEPRLSYANAILENWYAAGYKSPEDVKRAEEEWNKKKGRSKGADSSFATDDFYEAALMRSYKSDN